MTEMSWAEYIGLKFEAQLHHDPTSTLLSLACYFLHRITLLFDHSRFGNGPPRPFLESVLLDGYS